MTGSIDTITLFPLSAEVAWQRYLEATRGANAGVYERVEQEAWEQLQAALSHVRGDASPVG